MIIYLCPHLATEERVLAAKHTAVCFEAAGITVRMSQADSVRLFGDASREGALESADMIVSVGGDGAVLRAAQRAVRLDLPLMGINSGRLGFLCALEQNEMDGITAERLQAMPSETRSMLQIELDGGMYLALNDVVIARRRLAGTLTAAVFRDGRQLMRFRGDGLIVATPTGSTAYSRSAGGSVLLPDTGCLSLTPICPHTAGTAPMVVPDGDRYRVLVTDTGEDLADVLADGVTLGSLRGELTVTRYPRRLRLIRR